MGIVPILSGFGGINLKLYLCIFPKISIPILCTGFVFNYFFVYKFLFMHFLSAGAGFTQIC